MLLFNRPNTFILVFFLSVVYNTKAQDPLFVDWGRELNLNAQSYQGGMIALGDDNSVYVGVFNNRFYDEFDKDELRLGAKKQDVWIAKYDEFANRVWTQQIRDSANAGITAIEVFENIVMVSGSTNGWRSFEDLSGGDTIPGRSPVDPFIALYDATTGDLIKQIDVPIGLAINDLQFDENGRIWVAATIGNEVDIDLGNGEELVNYTTHPDFTGTFAQPDLVMICWDQEFNLIRHKQFPCYGNASLTKMSIAGNNIWTKTRLTSSVSNDTLVFNQDTAIISTSGYRQLLFQMDTLTAIKGALIARNNTEIHGIHAVDDEVLFSSGKLYDISGLVDTLLPVVNLNYAWAIYDGQDLFYYPTSTFTSVSGKIGTNYLVSESTQRIRLKSKSNELIHEIAPIGYNHLSFGIGAVQNPYTQEVAYGGRYYFDLNLRTVDRPLIIHGPEIGTQSDFFFGLLATGCNGGIVDSTIYSEPETQCGIHSVDKTVDIRGKGLSYQWYNTTKKDSLVSVNWFDACGFAQYIRGANNKRLEYQWCVANSSIEAEYVVQVEDACGNFFQSDTITINSYGEPEVLGNTIITDFEFETGDTLILDVLPVEGFDTVVYNWAKNDFFLYDFGRWVGTTTPHFELQGIGAQDAGIYRCYGFHPGCPDYVGKSIDLPIAIEGDTTVWNEWALGVADLVKQDLVEVYPSVFTTQLIIKQKSKSHQLSYQAIDLQGVVQAEGQLMNSQTVLGSESWPSGMYLLRVASEKGVQQLKLVKEND